MGVYRLTQARENRQPVWVQESGGTKFLFKDNHDRWCVAPSIDSRKYDLYTEENTAFDMPSTKFNWRYWSKDESGYKVDGTIKTIPIGKIFLVIL